MHHIQSCIHQTPNLAVTVLHTHYAHPRINFNSLSTPGTCKGREYAAGTAGTSRVRPASAVELQLTWQKHQLDLERNDQWNSIGDKYMHILYYIHIHNYIHETNSNLKTTQLRLRFDTESATVLATGDKHERIRDTLLIASHCYVQEYDDKSRITYLVGGCNTPEKYESRLGSLFPIYGKIA